jgi:hypothetical protein
MHVANVKMTDVATVVGRSGRGQVVGIGWLQCVVEGVQNARVMRLHHSAEWNLCWIDLGC